MKSSELRIGNAIKFTTSNDIILIESGARITDVEKCLKVIDSPFTYLPVKINDELIIRLQFKKYSSEGVVGFDVSNKNETTFYYEKGKFLIVQWGIDAPFYYSNHNLRVELKFIHQLQNLYFALVGEELVLRD